MKYLDAITDFFKSPKWVTNLLFAGLCVLVSSIIPLIGFIVLAGWLVTGFWVRNSEDFTTFPDFDFNQLGKYLERGLWPVLVTAVAAVVVGAVLWVIITVPILILTSLFSNDHGVVAGFIGLIISLVSLVLYLAIFAVLSLLLMPLSIRASLVQDFVKSFDFDFIKKFALLMWKEILISSLFMLVASSVLGTIGFFAFCVGYFLALGLVYFAWTHLSWQIYKLYLARGGEPVPVSSKLAAV